MSETHNLQLPLVQPAQAQKHVTVNEALTRLDGLAQLVLQSVSQATPPGAAADGTAWAVPAGATGDWSGQEGRVALRLNGGWDFATPQAGWRAWIADTGGLVAHDGNDWVPAIALGLHGSAVLVRVITIDHTIAAGEVSLTAPVLPERGVVGTVMGRILQPVSGTLTSWQLGVEGAENRYGNGLGLDAGSWFGGFYGMPVTYWAATPLKLSATGGDFAGGTVRLAIHVAEFVPPRA
jgi:hypothetical protein